MAEKAWGGVLDAEARPVHEPEEELVFALTPEGQAVPNCILEIV